MDPKSDEGIFLGYSTNGRAYRVFSSRTSIMMESINVIVDDHHEEANVTYDVETFFETPLKRLQKLMTQILPPQSLNQNHPTKNLPSKFRKIILKNLS